MLRITRIDDPVTVAPQVAEVYRSGFSIFRDGPSDEEVRAFAQDTLPAHAAREAFRFVAALEGEQLVGFIYGYHGRRGEWWEDWIRERLPTAIFDEWFTNQYDVTEFCVRAERHGEGIGSRLYDTLLAEVATTSYERAVLTTRRVRNPARGFYLNRGWDVVWDALDKRFSLLGLGLRYGGSEHQAI
ncbi:MAG: GNAT family N-acetyltransferase [Solirubrobacteraceae bacterium]